MSDPRVGLAIAGVMTWCCALAAEEGPSPVRIVVTVPTSGWTLKIAEVYEVGDEVWVLAEVREHGGIAAQVITRREATVPVTPAAGRTVRTFVGGATWNWRDPDARQVEFVDDLKAIRTKAIEAGGTLLHKAPEDPPPRAVYIVMFRKELFAKNGVTAAGQTLDDLARDRVGSVGGEVQAVLGIIQGCSAVLTAEAAEQLRQMPEVAALELDSPVQGLSPHNP